MNFPSCFLTLGPLSFRYIGIRGKFYLSSTIAGIFFWRWGRVDEAVEVRSGRNYSARRRSVEFFDQTVDVRPPSRLGDHRASQDLPIEVLVSPLSFVFARFDFRRKMADSALA